jgi:hypothetical protein
MRQDAKGRSQLARPNSIDLQSQEGITGVIPKLHRRRRLPLKMDRPGRKIAWHLTSRIDRARPKWLPVRYDRWPLSRRSVDGPS